MVFNEIQLLANNIPALANFYQQVMELPVVHSGEKSMQISAGNTSLYFGETQEIENPVYHFAFNIPSNKFEEAFKLMKNKVDILWLEDYKSYMADFTKWNAKSFYFEDPAGNILEMISRFDLNDLSNEPFSSRQIRNISEMGLVFPHENFDEEVNDLLQKFGLSYFKKQPPLPHFRAIGNDEGLFVVVPENRIWFGSRNKQAKIAPLQIDFTHADEGRTFKYG